MNTKNLVVIAEDDDISYQFLNTVLDKYGIPSVRVKNGVDAIKICLENEDVKLVLMDIKMPKLDGLKATIKIKEGKPDLIIIAQTAYALNSEKAELLREGCDDYLSKPIELDALVDVLKKYFDI
ncbi:MAG: response regulator [Candidatus Kapabacteria bacterium]|nr:response regulator [Candidatus Kapabacteria bacterium]